MDETKLVVKNGCQKNTRYDKIGVCAILSSKTDTMRRASLINQREDKLSLFNSTSYNSCI